ncbi:ABC transporter substrate-binding protein [Pectinatus sottacetonis]|uniref:ABC transporter substrate-binding protein n=1 Tax=Pectinatus sottacetonis TaxID=1002795 RepID=UPI0018C48805|nr:ABC transporter substrate-binding protein [Pectinatus sottacetonis]
MNLKKIAAVTMAMVSLAAFTGCGFSTTVGSGKNGEVQLKYWYAWQDKIAENNKERVKEFNDTVGKEKHIHVTAEYQGTYDDLQNKLQAAFAAKNAPAVAVIEISSMGRFAKANMLVPLDKWFSKEDLADFYPGLMGNSYIDEKCYGIPYLRSTPILYYNKTLFKKAGIDPDHGPATWQELAEDAKKLADIGVIGYGFETDPWHIEAMLGCTGATVLSKDEKSVTFNSSAAMKLYNFYRDGEQHNNFKYYNGDNASDNVNTAFFNQQLAMHIDSTSDISNDLAISKQNGFEIGTAFIPKNTVNSVPTGGCNLVMTNTLDEKQKEAAAEFIKFMTSPKEAVKSHIKTGYLPTRKSIANDPQIVELYKKHPQYKTAVDQLKYGHRRAFNPHYTEMLKIYTNTLDKIFTSNVNIKETIDSIVAKCNAILNQ